MTPPFLNGSQKKVLNNLTNEWQETANVGFLCGYKGRYIRQILNELKTMGAIECKRDLELNKSVWRIKQRGFVPASELKEEVL